MNTDVGDEMRDPEGAILGGDAGYPGSRVTMNETELDPDRAISFAIGFLDDWRISVRVSSSVLPPEVIDLEAEEEQKPDDTGGDECREQGELPGNGE